MFSIAITVGFILMSYLANFFSKEWVRLAYGIFGSIAAFLVTLLFLKAARENLAGIGLKPGRRTLKNFFAGALAGLLIMGTLAGTVMYFSGIRISINKNFTIWLFLLLTLQIFSLALMEEVGFRGYSLVLLKGKTGVRQSIFITSILFALYHIANGWSIASSFYGPAVWGLIFGIAAVYSKGLAAPTGLHFAVNLTTSAFGETGNKVSIWIVQQPDAVLSKPEGINWETILPSGFLLLFAIFCIEWYMRRMKIGS